MDRCKFTEWDTWARNTYGKMVSQSAPAIMARNMPLPEVESDGPAPFVCAATYPNGATGIATEGRVMFALEKADIILIAPSNPFVSIDPILNVYPIREMILRVAAMSGFWGYFFPLDITMSTSMIYELVEWGRDARADDHFDAFRQKLEEKGLA